MERSQDKISSCLAAHHQAAAALERNILELKNSSRDMLQSMLPVIRDQARLFACDLSEADLLAEDIDLPNRIPNWLHNVVFYLRSGITGLGLAQGIVESVQGESYDPRQQII